MIVGFNPLAYPCAVVEALAACSREQGMQGLNREEIDSDHFDDCVFQINPVSLKAHL